MNECKCEGCVKENETKITNAIKLIKTALKERKFSNSNLANVSSLSDLICDFEIMDLQDKNDKLESKICNQNTEIKKLKEEIEKFNTIIKHQQEQIDSLVQDNNNLHTENCEMTLAINDKDKEIEDLKENIDNLICNNSHLKTTNNRNVKEFTKIIELKDNEIEKIKESCKFFEDKANDLQKCLTTINHEDRRDYSGIFSRLKIIIQECESKVEQQAKIIKLKDNEIKDLKSYNELSTEKRNTAERQYENKYKVYDSKIKELDEKIVSLENELMYECADKEIIIANIEKCFRGYTQQLHFLDLYRKNSLYHLEELNKFTTSLNIKVDIT